MKITGLIAYLKENEHLFADHINLHDTDLIVDAKNVQYHFFEERDCIKYGGDLVSSGIECLIFFENLLSCNINPILVFEEPSQIHHEEYLYPELEFNRDKESLKRAVGANEGDSDSKELNKPYLLKQVFMNIINELGITKVSASSPASKTMIQVANEKRCPILTNNAGIINYPTSEGIIFLKYFTGRKMELTNGRFALECLVFRQDKLLAEFPGLVREKLPLFYLMMGSNYQDGLALGRFFSTIPKYYHPRMINPRMINPRNGKPNWTAQNMTSALNWLSKKSIDQAIDQIHFRYPTKRDKEQIKSWLRNCSVNQPRKLGTELDKNYPLRAGNQKKPSVYLQKLFEEGFLTNDLLGIIFHYKPTFRFGIENLSLPFSGEVFYRPARFAVTLLRPQSYADLSDADREKQIKSDTFRILARKGIEFEDDSLLPLTDCQLLEDVDCYSLVTLEKEKRKEILFEAFRFGQDELDEATSLAQRIFANNYLSEATICLLLLRYIAIETKTTRKSSLGWFVSAIMLTLFYYALKQPEANLVSSETGARNKQLQTNLAEHSEVTRDWIQSIEPNEDLFRSIMHLSSQLQWAYVGFYTLNGLLDQPLQTPRVERFFNGPMIYRLTRLMTTGEISLKSICGENSKLIDFLEKARDFGSLSELNQNIVTTSGPNYFVYHVPQV